MIELNQQEVETVCGGAVLAPSDDPAANEWASYSSVAMGGPPRSNVLQDPAAEFMGIDAYYIA